MEKGSDLVNGLKSLLSHVTCEARRLGRQFAPGDLGRSSQPISPENPGNSSWAIIHPEIGAGAVFLA